MNFSKRKKLIWEQDSQESVENLKVKVLLEFLIENGEVSDDTTLDDIEQSDDYYEVPTFEVDEMRFGVGTEYEMEMSAKENISDFIDQEGLDSFNTNFVREFLDVEEVIIRFRDIYDDMVRDAPEEYLKEEDRMLSKSESQQVEVLENRVLTVQKYIEQFENMPERRTDKYFNIKITELAEALEIYNEEIEEIKSSPSGNFPEELIEEVIEDLLNDVRSNPLQSVNDWDIELSSVINVDDLIQGMIDLEGYETLASYDGVINEIYENGQTFYIFRID
jgi:hypothetical protein